MPTVVLSAAFSLLALLWLRRRLVSLRPSYAVAAVVVGLVLPLWIIGSSTRT